MRTCLFAVTLFLSAALSFLVQPLVGKLLLPLLGGTPAVWNTCLVFFQAALLLGYSYAHGSAGMPAARQARWHWLVLLVPVLAFGLGVALVGDPLPVVARLLPTGQDNPILALLLVLLLAVGVPFAVLATTAPLLQRWHGGAGSYALYVASNAGSLVGLLGYPLLIEPWLPLPVQQWAWSGGVVVSLGLIAACGLLARDGPVEANQPAPRRLALGWVALAALPAALLTSVSSVLTSEIAPVPLLWVVPLALYLLSFIVVFAGWSERAQAVTWRVAIPFVLFVVLMLMTHSTEPLLLAGLLHLGCFFLLCLTCHGQLVLRRPPTAQLTAFYLALATGGVLGSLVAGLLAPVVFWRAGLLEYPLALILTTFVRPRQPVPVRFAWLDVVFPLVLGLGTVGLILLAPVVLGELPADGHVDQPLYRAARLGFTFGVPLALTFALVWRPVRFALALTALLLASWADTTILGRVLTTERNFFGCLRVVESRDGKFRRLIHGATQHGQQATASQGKPTPLLYYHPTGPIGRVLAALPDARRRRVGAVGLGCGAIAAYAKPGEVWTFFEIDPAVARLAQDTRYFTFLATCEGDWTIDLGDARRRLGQRDDLFDVLILDAFSSDAIPVHLLTREALALYLDRLAPQGVLAFHVSNRYLDLPPLLARLGDERGLVVRVDHDYTTESERAAGKSASSWVVLVRQEADLGRLARDVRWFTVPVVSGPIWTDQFSNLLGVWRREE